LLEDTGFTFSPDVSLFGPTGGDIEGIDEDTGEGIAAMGTVSASMNPGLDSSH